jgi:hypothetical protein
VGCCSQALTGDFVFKFKWDQVHAPPSSFRDFAQLHNARSTAHMSCSSVSSISSKPCCSHALPDPLCCPCPKNIRTLFVATLQQALKPSSGSAASPLAAPVVAGAAGGAKAPALLGPIKVAPGAAGYLAAPTCLGAWQRLDIVHPKESPAPMSASLPSGGARAGGAGAAAPQAKGQAHGVRAAVVVSGVMLAPSQDVLGGTEMFHTMRFYARKGSTIAASSGSGNDSQDVRGIVQARAASRWGRIGYGRRG